MRLSVNIDHVATIREARKSTYPDPVMAAALAELGGSHGIVVHLREDRRHIKDRDLRILRETVSTSLNMEMAATREMVEIACDVKPDVATLVPEKRQELTTEGGLDVIRNAEQIHLTVEVLQRAGIQVSLFIDPVAEQIRLAGEIRADAVEIHTGRYCEAAIGPSRDQELEKVMHASREARSLGLSVRAGHGLDYTNVVPVAQIPEVEEVSIGHSIVARAVLVGMERAVRDMVVLVSPPIGPPSRT